MKKRFLALFMTFVMMFTLIPVDAFATDAVDTPSGVVVEATQEEVPENTETETPVVEEPVLDPVQQLYDALMACATYEELDAYMEAMSEEDYALMAQFTDEQNAALTAKIQQLQENDVDELANRTVTAVWPADMSDSEKTTLTVTFRDGNRTRNATLSASNNWTDTQNISSYDYRSISGLPSGYSATVSRVSGGNYVVTITKDEPGTINHTFGHLDVRIQNVSFKLTHNIINMVTGQLIETKETTITASVIGVDSVTINGTEYTGFGIRNSNEYRKSNVAVKITANSEAVLVVDLIDSNGKRYNNVEITYNRDGIQYAIEHCNGYRNNNGNIQYDGIDFDPSQGSNNITLVEYDEYVIPVQKIWDDANNQDGIRPESVTFNLYANGEKVADIVLNAGNNWTYMFTDMPSVDENEEPIAYTIDEVSAPDKYTKSEPSNNGIYLTVTNSYKPAVTTVSVSKEWSDAENQDGIRPDEVTVQLKANGVAYGDVVTLNEGNKWSHTWNELPKNEAGVAIAYTVEEVDVHAEYTAAVTGSMADGFVITNSHTPATVEVSGTKTWDDNDNQDGIRPASITINLFADGTKADETTVTADDNWTYKFENLPKYKNGTEIEYTITENSVKGYTVKIDGFNVTNTHEVEKTEVTVEKVWDDNNDQDGKRPESITINLLADGVVAKTATVTAEDEWTYTFTDLDKFAAGKEIVYTVTEDAVADYTTKVEGFTVTNTHTPETVEVSGTKTWVDADDQDGKRPASITINLLANGKEVDSVEVTAEDDWKFTFTDLPKYEAGTEIVYTITENSVDGYETEIKDFDVTNTHTPEKTEVTVTKVWDDNDNQDGIRPESITVNLLANGEVVATATVTAEGEWKYTFTDLDKYAAGQEIEYTVEEAAVEGYEATVDGLTITNTHTPETITVEGTKTWDDADNQDGIRPDSITINLLADGEIIETVEVTDDSWTFTDLPKFKDGVEIVYTIEEEAVEGYTATVDGFNVTNTHEVEKTEVTVTKEWDDADNQDGIRPESITVNLMGNGKVVATATVTAEEEWTYTFTDLDKYADGKEIEYTVEEAAVEGYEATVDGLTITNTHTPETITVEGAKTWDDADNQDGIRPGSITINLLADGEVVETKTTQSDSWTFTNLPKFKDGVEIVYTITEEPVEGYEATVDGYNVTNTHEVEKTEVTVEKLWDDADNQDGIRPESITVNLLANGEVVATATVTAEEWTYTFTDLDKYADGKEIEYTVEEAAVEGYTATVEGLVITNTHTPETITVEGAKTWDDGNDQDGIRPDSITINLLADGEIIETVEVTDDSWTFENLPKFRDGGVEIIYTITEEPVEGYEATVDGYNVTNTHTPEVITIKGEKVWDDADNQDGIRPETVIINLLANDKVVNNTTVAAGEDGTWTFEFVDVPKYEAGEEIVYTVTEEAVEGYTATVDGFTVTNTHTPEQTEVTVNKVWVDDDNNDGIRPESVTINLLNGETVVDTAVLNEENQWTYTFAELDKFVNGKEITYKVTEEAVEGYTDAVTEGETGFVVTNTHESKVIGITVNKVWQGGTGESATIKLYANGEEFDSVELTAETEWTHTFENLKVYADGEEIVYTVDETDVPANYRKSVKLDTVDETTGNRVYTVTNIKNDPYIPPTNEGGNTTMWMGIMTASLLAMGGLTLVYKKRY